MTPYAINLTRSRRTAAGFTLVEVLVSAMAGVLLLGGLVVATVQLRATALATDRYAKSQAEQIRMIDYIARDLRIAVSVGANNASTPMKVGGTTFLTLSGSNTLVLQLPDYYTSNDPSSFADYKTIKPLYSYRTGVAYGDGTAAQSYTTVTYQKVDNGDDTFNYVRTENGEAETIVIDQGDLMDVDISLATSGVGASATNRVFILESYYIARFRWPPWETTGRARVTSSDRIMLRNPRIDL